ncbi:MAG: hypothetical protein P8Y69_11355 [Gammaproteobacteria bacterium]
MAAIVVAWSLKDQNLIRADDGLGYWLGIVGASLMLLLLVYPLRKRIAALKGFGSVRFWFRLHMIFGIVGPLLVLFHSNFNLGSLNGRVALFCTLVVASSGIVGRYLYAKIHHGMYGQRATLESLQRSTTNGGEQTNGMLGLAELVDAGMRPHEQKVLSRATGVLPSILGMITAPWTVRRLRWTLRRAMRSAIADRANGSLVIAEHEARLLTGSSRYLETRLTTFRKLAQLRGYERLFSLWHIVHFPLFLVMVAAAILHVVAVHAY